MKLRFSAIVSVAIAAAVGWITLLGYFVDVLFPLRLQMVMWASMMSAVAIWLGVFNLLGVHGKKIMSGSIGELFNSLILLLTMFVVMGLGIAERMFHGTEAKTIQQATALVFALQSTIGTAISSLLVFFLIYAGYRLLRRPPSVMMVTFVLSAIISLLSMLAIPTLLPEASTLPLRSVWLSITQVPAVAAVAGVRGVLLGLSLGVVTTGLRILLASDRPYGE